MDFIETGEERKGASWIAGISLYGVGEQAWKCVVVVVVILFVFPLRRFCAYMH